MYKYCNDLNIIVFRITRADNGIELFDLINFSASFITRTSDTSVGIALRFAVRAMCFILKIIILVKQRRDRQLNKFPIVVTESRNAKNHNVTNN